MVIHHPADFATACRRPSSVAEGIGASKRSIFAGGLCVKLIATGSVAKAEYPDESFGELVPILQHNRTYRLRVPVAVTTKVLAAVVP